MSKILRDKSTAELGKKDAIVSIEMGFGVTLCREQCFFSWGGFFCLSLHLFTSLLELSERD